MKTKHLLLALLLTFAFSSAQAQWGNKLKNKILDKVESKADEKADQAINNAVDKPVDKTEAKVKESVKSSGSESETGNQPPGGQGGMSEEQMNQMLQMFGGGAVSIEDYPDLADIEPSDFTGSFDMDMETYKNGKLKDEGKVSWYIRPYDVAMIPIMENNGQKQDARIIINRKKGTMTMLTDDNGRKSGFVMQMKTISVDLSKTEMADDFEDMEVNVYKNETKMIDGYKCYKVTASNDDFSSESWVTESLPIDMVKLMNFLNVQSKGKNPYEEKFGHIRGMVMESTSTDKKTGEKSMMKLSNIKTGAPNAAMFSTDGYDLMAMPGF